MTRHPRNPARSRCGFTLLELIVTVTIIAVLVSILVPVVAKARRTAGVARARRDLETIATALEAYKGVYRMYPQVAPLPTAYNTTLANNINNVDGLPMYTDNGAHALYTALMMRVNVRITRSSNSSVITIGGSQAYGPFVDAGKLKVVADTSTGYQTPAPNFIGDANGHPILYVPAYNIPVSFTKTATVTPTGQYIGDSSTAVSGIPFVALYDFHAIPLTIADPNTGALIAPFHNTTYAGTGMNEMRVMMGDTSQDGIIDQTASPPEAAAYTGPYILWSPGADGQFGINSSTGKSDDVTNFPLPVNLQE